METNIPIIIGFSKPKNKKFPIFSLLIRLFEGTKYSHVYTRWYSSGADVDVCYHASGTQVNFVSKRIFDSHVYPVEEYELQISRETYKKLLHFCMYNAGVHYGLKQLFGIPYVKFMSLFNKSVKNPFSDGAKTQVCSEVVGHILEDVIGVEVNEDLDIAGPKKINTIIKKLVKIGIAKKIL